MRISTILALFFLLAACPTPGQARDAAAVGQAYQFKFVNQGGDDVDGIAMLEQKMKRRLSAAGLLDAGAAGVIDVTLQHYYMRSGGARAWTGIMSGRDKIVSQVRVLGADGAELSSFTVKSTNITAFGSAEGLMDKHVDELLSHFDK